MFTLIPADDDDDDEKRDRQRGESWTVFQCFTLEVEEEEDEEEDLPRCFTRV